MQDADMEQADVNRAHHHTIMRYFEAHDLSLASDVRSSGIGGTGGTLELPLRPPCA